MDAEIFKHTVMPHYRRMYLAALRITGDPDDAQDAVQDAVTNLWQQRDRLKNADNMASYTAIAARNAAVSMLRRQRPAETLENLAKSDPAQNPAEALSVRDRLNHVMRIIDDLPVTQKQVIIMRDVENYEFDEIARATGLSNVNVRTLLSRARATIRKHFA